jgi:hypothetical protein
MGAPKGNSFWKSRSKHGRDKLFDTPESLLESATGYFQWCDENPWESTKSVISDKGDIFETKPVQRPYTKSGWYHYIGCSKTWLVEFKKVASKDFLIVISEIEDFIENQQWEGAAVGAFNANIIARTLGLKDSQDVTTKGESMNTPTPISFVDKSKEDE